MLPFSKFYSIQNENIVGYLRSLSPLIQHTNKKMFFYNIFFSSQSPTKSKTRRAAFMHTWYNISNFHVNTNEWMHKKRLGALLLQVIFKIIPCKIDKYGIFVENFVCHSTHPFGNQESIYGSLFPFFCLFFLFLLRFGPWDKVVNILFDWQTEIHNDNNNNQWDSWFQPLRFF